MPSSLPLHVPSTPCPFSPALVGCLSPSVCLATELLVSARRWPRGASESPRRLCCTSLLSPPGTSICGSTASAQIDFSRFPILPIHLFQWRGFRRLGFGGLPTRHLANNTTDLLVRYSSIHPRTHQRAQFRVHSTPHLGPTSPPSTAGVCLTTMTSQQPRNYKIHHHISSHHDISQWQISGDAAATSTLLSWASYATEGFSRTVYHATAPPSGPRCFYEGGAS